MTREQHAEVYKKAVKAGCKPFWYDGIVGWAWHCGCDQDKEKTHYVDQQCSVVKFYRTK